MHGQKKRRKRLLKGTIKIAELNLCWELLSEPLWSTEHGYQGLCISVQTEDKRHRELILAFPFPRTKLGSPLSFPLRPQFSEKTIIAGTQKAMKAGWNPTSRGKTFVHYLAEVSNRGAKPGCERPAAPVTLSEQGMSLYAQD